MNVVTRKRLREAAVAELERLMESKPDSELSEDEGSRIELLGLLIQKWEDEQFGPPKATPRQVLEFVMEQRGLEQHDLADAFGDAARVSDFLAGRRGLSLPTIVALHRQLHIPYEALIDESIRRKPRGVAAKRRRVSVPSIAREKPARYRPRRSKR